MADLKKLTLDGFVTTVPKIAPYFDATASYNKGDIVSYNGATYIFMQDHTGAWNASHVDETTVGEQVTDLWNNKADIIITSASGSIAHIEDAGAYPVVDLKVGIEPVQDLHGYDSPWPAGGGNQKFNPSSWEQDGISRRTWGTDSPNFVSALNILPEGTYTVVAKIKIDTVDAEEGNRTYGFLCTGVSVDGRVTKEKQTVGTIVTIAKTFTLSAGQVGAFTHCYWYAGTSTSTTEYSTIYDMGINVGSVTTYIPYSNICPISGHTGVEIKTSGLNIANKTEFSITQPEYYTGTYWLGLTANQDGTYTLTRPIGWGGIGYVYLGTFPAGTYAFSYDVIDTASVTCGASVLFKKRGTWTNLAQYNKANISSAGTYSSTLTATETFDAWIAVGPYTDNNKSVISGNYQIQVGSAASPYSAFSGSTLPITWQTEAGTVYKGSLDLITGELKSYPYYASYNGETLTGHWISSMDVYAEGTSPSIGAQVINDGAEPTVYNLTPPEIFTLLKGVNNIWNDVGNTDAVYKADTKLFIEKAIAEAVAAL